MLHNFRNKLHDSHLLFLNTEQLQLVNKIENDQERIRPYLLFCLNRMFQYIFIQKHIQRIVIGL